MKRSIEKINAHLISVSSSEMSKLKQHVSYSLNPLNTKEIFVIIEEGDLEDTAFTEIFQSENEELQLPLGLVIFYIAE